MLGTTILQTGVQSVIAASGCTISLSMPSSGTLRVTLTNNNATFGGYGAIKIEFGLSTVTSIPVLAQY